MSDVTRSDNIGVLFGALAVLNVSGVLAGVVLCHDVIGRFEDSVGVNRTWAARAGDVSELAQVATQANAPGNDVFETRAVAAERARLHEKLAAYAELDAAARADFGTLPPAQARALLEPLDRAASAVTAMGREAEAIFDAFDRGDAAAAGERMAGMDRQLALANDALAAVSHEARGLQAEAFAAQSDVAQQRGTLAYGLVGVVAALVAGAVGYGRHLSRTFAAASAAIARRNADLQRVLDHAGQGFATVDLDGRLSVERSAMFDVLLAGQRDDATIDEVLGRTSTAAAEWMRMGLESLRDGFLPTSLCLEQLPQRLQVGDRAVAFEYRPIGGAEAPSALLLVVSDVTAALARERMEEENREVTEVFQRAMHDREGVIEFFAEATELVRRLSAGDAALDDEARWLHTLKGNAALFGMQRLARLCHALEDARGERCGGLDDAERAQLAAHWDATVSRLRTLLGHEREQLVEVEHAELADIIDHSLRGASGELLAARLAVWRLEPVGRRLERLRDQARAFARRMGRGELTVVLDPGRARLSRRRWAPLWASLVHVLRNAIDHGIEPAEERVAAGKAAEGTLVLRTGVERGTLTIEIADDGRGIDWDGVRARAAGLGLPTATHDDLVAALFADGLSTRDGASETSGRGVGLAAVRQEVERVGGAIAVDSAPGTGTRFRVSVPCRDAETAIDAFRDPAARVA